MRVKGIVRSCASVVLAIGLAGAAGAHDPGLSAAQLERTDGHLLVQVTFATADVPERDPQALRTLAAAAVECRAGGRALVPGFAGGRVNGADVELRAIFPDPGTPVVFRSGLLPDLPRGHRQSVSVRDAHGGWRVERILTTDEPEFTWAGGTPRFSTLTSSAPSKPVRFAVLIAVLIGASLWWWRGVRADGALADISH